MKKRLKKQNLGKQEIFFRIKINLRKILILYEKIKGRRMRNVYEIISADTAKYQYKKLILIGENFI